MGGAAEQTAVEAAAVAVSEQTVAVVVEAVWEQIAAAVVEQTVVAAEAVEAV